MQLLNDPRRAGRNFPGLGEGAWVRMVNLEAMSIHRLATNWFAVHHPGEADYLRRAGELAVPDIREQRGWHDPERPLSPQADPPSRTQWSFFTYPGLVRKIRHHLAIGLEERLGRLENQLVKLDDITESLANWRHLADGDRAELLAGITGLTAELENAYSSRRVDTRRRLENSRGVRDSRGRVNPQAKGVELAAAEPRLQAQAGDDRRSQRANAKRALALHELDTRWRSGYRNRIFYLLEQPVTPGSLNSLRANLDQLAFKYDYFAANFAGWLLDRSVPTPKTYEMIRRAFVAELVTEQLDALLAALQAEPLGFRGSQESLRRLTAQWFRLDLAPYRRLGQRLNRTVSQMKQAMLLDEPDKSQKLKQLAEEAKRLIRYRIEPDNPDSRIWLPAHLHELLG